MEVSSDRSATNIFYFDNPNATSTISMSSDVIVLEAEMSALPISYPKSRFGVS